MTARQPRDTREDAKHALAHALRREGHRAPDVYALELLVVLEGAHIGLTDTTPPIDPNADPWVRPVGTGPAVTELPEDHPYRIARAAKDAERDTPLAAHQQPAAPAPDTTATYATTKPPATPAAKPTPPTAASAITTNPAPQLPAAPPTATDTTNATSNTPANPASTPCAPPGQTDAKP